MTTRPERQVSLGSRVVIACVLLVVSPLVFVAVSAIVELAFAGRTEQRAEQCAMAVGDAWVEVAPIAAAAEASCRDHNFRVRILEGAAATVDRLVADHLATSGPRDRFADIVYGPERVASLARFEDSLPPIAHRAETRLAHDAGSGRVCTDMPDANLRVCSFALRVVRRDVSAIVHVIGSSRTAGESRQRHGRQLAAMSISGAVLAAGLAFWMRRRVTEPVRTLARDVEALARSGDTRLHGDRPRELADVAFAFNRLRDALARADAQNESFLADLAHEMKNPVAAISAAAESLETTTTDDPEARAKLLRAIATSAGRLDRLVRQFLVLARAEAGLPNEERERVDLGALASGVAGSTDAPESLVLSIDVGGEPLPIEGVPARLEAALRNVLDNALSFASAHVVVRALRDGEAIVVEVRDDGPGIAAADLVRVFDRFFTARGDGRGTGLGLAIVKATVEAHGGSVAVRSDPSAGTTFELRFPGALADRPPG